MTTDIHLGVLKNGQLQNGGLQNNSSDAIRHSIEHQLAAVVNGEIRFSQHDRMLYSTDASLYQVEPIGVVIPNTVADGIEAVRVCGRLGVPILARGGGTALAGQTVNHAVVVDFSANCREILQIDPVARRVRVEPGVVLDQLNRHFRHTG